MIRVATRQTASDAHAESVSIGLSPQAGAPKFIGASVEHQPGFNMDIQITRAGSQPSNKGPTDWFTGTVRIDPLFQPKEPARAAAASVTFEPGARTAWHTHP